MEQELTDFFSVARLKKYKLADEGFETALNRYQWNIQLAEALLPALCYFEIGLRNGLNRAIIDAYGANWLLNIPQKLLISVEDQRKIDDYKNEITANKGWNPTHDDIVAKLGFGFWGSFFRKHYDPLLWHLPKPIVTIFPNLQRSLRMRRYIAPKLHNVRTLRNRIAHHEPIWHLKELQTTYQTCIELIYGMSAEAALQLARIDRFNSIYTNGLAYLPNIQKKIA